LFGTFTRLLLAGFYRRTHFESHPYQLADMAFSLVHAIIKDYVDVNVNQRGKK